MKFSTIILLFLILTGCKQYKKDIETININVNSDTKKPYHEIAKISKLIPLATDSNYIIHEVSKIYILKNKINILDKRMSSVYTFDKSGKFLFKISQLGSGVGKYMRIDDFESNNDGSIIKILDGISNKLITYSEGKFVKEINLPFRADAFASYKDRMVFHRDIAPYSPDLMYQIIVTDKNLQIIDKFIKIKKTSDLVFSPQNPLQKKETSISFLAIYSPYLFNISAEGISEKYLLDFGKNWINDDFIYSRKNSNTFISDLSQSDYVYFLNTVEGDLYLTISFMLKHKLYTAVYNKEKKNLIFISDFNSNYCGDFGFQTYQENQFVSIIKPEQLLDSYKTGKNKQKDNEIEKIIGSVKGNDNPIIMMTSFRF